ncbi:hypothetical protein FBU59_004197, partial [Linderina macrospora]
MNSSTRKLTPRRGFSSQKRKDAKPADPEETAKPTTSNKRSLTFAIGGVLTLLGVASYTFSLRQTDPLTANVPTAGLSTVGVPTTTVSTTTATQSKVLETLQSVEKKRAEARQKLDKLTYKERREEARKLGLLTEEEVDAILHAKEKSWCTGGDPLRLRIDTNQVSSNNPIEDYLAWDELVPAKQDGVPRYMFGVFDGHAGYMCAEQIAQRIGPMLNQSLALVKQAEAAGDDASQLAGTVRQLTKEAGLDWDHMALALTATFINMDRELVHNALAEFRRSQDLSRIDELLGPAVSGSCGLVAVVDGAAREVVVANTGDSRALLGVQLADGRWKAVRLSEDQTADNRQELARLAREHPGEAVIKKNRVLGGLMPTRAFGDSRYKWTLETQQDLFPVLRPRGHRYATTPENFLSPPYVTARPVIVRHKLADTDKFIVIASDGLYDQLSDAEVVDTVAQWYEAQHKPEGSSLATPDENAATHLIRTALSTDRLGR